MRRVGDRVLLLAPRRNEIRLLGPTATVVWCALEKIADRPDLDDLMRATYPQIPEEERHRAVDEILASLTADGLVSII